MPTITRAWVRLIPAADDPALVVPLVQVEWAGGNLGSEGTVPIEPDCPCMLEHVMAVLADMEAVLQGHGLSSEAVLEAGLELP